MPPWWGRPAATAARSAAGARRDFGGRHARPAAQRLALTRDTGELLTAELSIDAAASRLRLDDSTLDYRQHDSTLRLTGEFDGAPVGVTLHRIPPRGETRDFR